jgi:DNA-binding IclR family transcriptional regulator
MAEARDLSIAAVEKAMRVVEFLGRGDVLGWKSVREVAAGAEVSNDEALRLLHTLAKGKWAEQSKRGFRLAATGFLEILRSMQEYFIRLAKSYGVKLKMPGLKER